MSTYKNNTGQDVTITYCVEDHWEEKGPHHYGDYEDCKRCDAFVAQKSLFHFDVSEPNGEILKQLCEQNNLTEET